MQLTQRLRWMFLVALLVASLAMFIRWPEIFWTQEAAGWAQALGSVGAIIAAVWLQDRGRKKEKADRLHAQREAVLQLAEKAAEIVERLDQKCREHNLTIGLIGHYVDETGDFAATFAAMPWLTLEDPALIASSIELRTAMTTAHRRTIQVRRDLRGEAEPTPRRFTSCARDAKRVLAELKEMQRSH